MYPLFKCKPDNFLTKNLKFIFYPNNKQCTLLYTGDL